ncbi:hypothetical protein [Lentibacillus sp. Marseille-P4043]|uniref:hypothetical protein n=1 Tax=Lentibacillus sp. Marseille-P4043 TaxID=2040293 RepID=UPI000D0B3926|nr:hypothetical protein [Lentibacillus sp. Marseille-P4043]
MDKVKEGFERWHVERMKEEMKELIEFALQDGVPARFIERIIKRCNFSKEEVKKIYEGINDRRMKSNT